MIQVLINAYACAPNRGSEPGMAWNWITNLANHCKLHIITEGEWKQEIETEIAKLPQGKNIQFYYNPVSDKIRKMCWNQGDWRFYYYYKKWQQKTLLIAQEIIKSTPIDVIHQLNMIGFREPGFLYKIPNKPFIWGPIGGMTIFPESYLQNSSLKTKLFVTLKNKINILQIKHSNRFKKAISRSNALICATNDEVLALQKYHQQDSILIPETGCFEKPIDQQETNSPKDAHSFSVIWVGKFDFRKQLHLAMQTIAELKHLKGLSFHIVGTGNETQVEHYKNLSNSLDLQDIIKWHGQITNQEVISLMNQSDLFFFTSVSEATSTVVLEAINNQLPVLCFNACGFGAVVNQLVGKKIEFTTPQQSINEFAKKIEYLYTNRSELQTLSKNCITHQNNFLWSNKAIEMYEIYKKTIQKK